MLVVNVGKNKGRIAPQYGTTEILTDKLDQFLNPKLNNFLDIKLKDIVKTDLYKNIKTSEQKHNFLVSLLSLAEHLEHVMAPIDNKNNFTDDFIVPVYEKANTLKFHSDLDYIIARLDSYEMSLIDILIEKIGFLSFPAIREIKTFLIDAYSRLNINDSLTIGQNKLSARS